ncbi:MAG: WS/DGAT/MGAT family O-acyltransferase [Nevskiales bacterium]
MALKYLSPIDAAFLRMESKRTPMHVGAMMTFRLPEEAPPDFLRQLIARMREHPFMPPPFGARLASGRLARVAPAWQEVPVDMDYHLRHSALPYPGGERELGRLVERLHSHPLDLSRPLWECHIIEGLENRRFALYFKAHHCAIDGMGAMSMVQKWLSTDPKDDRGLGPWVLASKPPKSEIVGDKASLWTRLKKPARAAADQARGFKELVKGLRTMTRGEDSGTRAAMSTPRSRFNVAVSQQRRLGTQILDLKRLKAVADASGTSVNDVLLAVCGGAVRRYLLEYEALPEKALLASVPVALPRPDGSAGNAVAGFTVPLGTNLDDPNERLKLIHRVTKRSKQELMSMPLTALSQFALLGLSPLILGQMLGVLPKMPPFFNFVVSNVVLSKHPLYLMGAELEAMYPVSFLFDGYALNITLVGYTDRVAVGFLGCREAIPRLQRLAVYTRDALTELEKAVGVAKAPKKKKTPARRAKRA